MNAHFVVRTIDFKGLHKHLFDANSTVADLRVKLDVPLDYQIRHHGRRVLAAERLQPDGIYAVVPDAVRLG